MRGGHGLRTLVAVGMACAALLTAGPAAGVGALSPRPSYLDPTVSYFSVVSNSHWVVGGFHASQFGGTPAPSTHGYNIAGNEKPQYMWGQRCTAARQQLTFHRTIWLPGQPETLQFYANPTAITYWSEPFTSIELIVNDRLIVNSHRSSVFEQLYGDTLPKAFRPGLNNIVVSVTKPANPSFVKSCGANSSTRLGLQVGLVGQGFPVDLAVKPVPTDEKTQWIHVKPGDSVPFLYHFTVTNNGPSASGAGQFGFLVQPGYMTFATPVGDVPEEPFTCSPTAANGWSGTNCTYNNWLAVGKSVVLTAYWKVTAPTDQSNADVEQMDLQWGVGTMNEQRDHKSTNDSTGKLVYFCYPQATTYGCDKN